MYNWLKPYLLFFFNSLRLNIFSTREDSTVKKKKKRKTNVCRKVLLGKKCLQRRIN